MKIQFKDCRSIVWLLAVVGVAFLAYTPQAQARFPHGGWVSRDLERIDNEAQAGETLTHPSTLWVVSMEDGDGGGFMTAWSFCTAEKSICEQICERDGDRSNCEFPSIVDPSPPADSSIQPPREVKPGFAPCTPPCKTRHITPSESQQLYSSPGVSPDGRWVMFGTKDKVVHSFYWMNSVTGWVHSSWSEYEHAVANDRCDRRTGPGEGDPRGKFCKEFTLEVSPNDQPACETAGGRWDEPTTTCKEFVLKPTSEEKKPFTNGFHSRPLHVTVTHTIYDEYGNPVEPKKNTDVFVAVNVGNNNEGYLHTFEIDPSNGQLQRFQRFNEDKDEEGTPPLVLEDAQGYLFDLLPDNTQDLLRVLVAADDSDNKTDFPVRAIGFNEVDCDRNKQLFIPCAIGSLQGPHEGGSRVASHIKAGARLGGVILEDVVVDGGTQKDLLVYNLNHGVLAMSLEEADWGEIEWHRYLKQVHRTKPTVSRTDRDTNYQTTGNPILYIGQRQGGVCKGGQARVYRLDAGTGFPSDQEPQEDAPPGLDNYEVQETGGYICNEKEKNSLAEGSDLLNPADDECVGVGIVQGENQPRPMFPGCYEEKIGNASFSSPMVNPVSGHVFFGPAHPGDPIYKVDPRNPQRSWELDDDQKPADEGLLHNYSRVGWFDYAPSNGWRTNATFSADGHTMFIGSAGGIVYAMDADESCGVVRWCYDTRNDGDSTSDGVTTYTPNGGYCGHADNIACCNELTDADLPNNLQHLENRRIAEQCGSCWDEGNNPINCKIARVWNGIDYIWNDGESMPADPLTRHDVPREPVIVKLSDVKLSDIEEPGGSIGSYLVSFKLQLNEADNSEAVEDVVAIEAMNDATKEVFSSQSVPVLETEDGKDFYEFQLLVPHPVTAPLCGEPAPTVPIRFALFDDYGNESMVRVSLEEVGPPGACP